jgi:hypothetical protein
MLVHGFKDSVRFRCNISTSILLEETYNVIVEIVVASSAIVVVEGLDVVGYVIDALVVDGDDPTKDEDERWFKLLVIHLTDLPSSLTSLAILFHPQTRGPL